MPVRAGARSERDPARVGEAETGVAGRAFGEHGGEDTGPLVEVVVDFGRGLVLVGAQDPAYVLGQAALVGEASAAFLVAAGQALDVGPQKRRTIGVARNAERGADDECADG